MYIQLAVHTENPIYCKNLMLAHKTKDTSQRVCSNRLALLYVTQLMLTSNFKNKRESCDSQEKKMLGKQRKRPISSTWLASVPSHHIFWVDKAILLPHSCGHLLPQTNTQAFSLFCCERLNNQHSFLFQVFSPDQMQTYN